MKLTFAVGLTSTDSVANIETIVKASSLQAQVIKHQSINQDITIVITHTPQQQTTMSK